MFVTMFTRGYGKNLNIVSMCAVSPVVHTSNISSCQKKISFPVAVKNSNKVGPCNHGEHYETPCILCSRLPQYFWSVEIIVSMKGKLPLQVQELYNG